MTKPTAILLSAVILAFPPDVTLSAQVEKAEQEQDEWDIEQTLGPTIPLSFETDEGTWMNVDLDPAGGTLAFDLLGDLYAMPITGGTATRISSGQSFDMQPRPRLLRIRGVYSPWRPEPVARLLLDAKETLEPPKVVAQSNRENEEQSRDHQGPVSAVSRER